MLINIGLYRFKFGWIPVVMTLVAFVILARLGFWQLSRGEEKQQRLTQIANYQQYDLMSFDNLLNVMKTYEPTGITVKVQGQFATPYSWLLDNKIVKGQPGYDVLLAMQPQGYDQYLLVNMGWLKGDYANRDTLPSFDIPQGAVTIEAFVKAKDLASFALSEQSVNKQKWPLRTQQVDIERLEQQSGLRFYPFMLYAQQANDFGFTHHYEPVVMPPEKHRAYAMQWFLLALAVIIVFIFASRVTISENKNERT
jgi:cytochrome oxidase assembly protein ShyY1